MTLNVADDALHEIRGNYGPVGEEQEFLFEVNATEALHMTYTRDGQGLLAVGQSHTGQISLLGLGADGKIKGRRSLGAINSYRPEAIISTADGGAAVLATTWVAARFPQVAFFKLSPEEVRALVGG
jgi:hypothetical protein